MVDKCLLYWHFNIVIFKLKCLPAQSEYKKYIAVKNCSLLVTVGSALFFGVLLFHVHLCSSYIYMFCITDLINAIFTKTLIVNCEEFHLKPLYKTIGWNL